MNPGKIYLVPSWLSDDQPQVLPLPALGILHRLDSFIVENEKSARAFLKAIGSPVPQANFHFQVLDEHTSEKDIPAMLKPVKEGKDVGLLSEAGCPAVADPGSKLVKFAHRESIRVIPLIGPSSIMLALMASGMNGQQFRFHGYLPRDPLARKKKLKELEKAVESSGETQAFIETPYRNMAMISDLLSICHGETLLCIACDLSSPQELISTKTISSWKKTELALNKRPAVFLLGR